MFLSKHKLLTLFSHAMLPQLSPSNGRTHSAGSWVKKHHFSLPRFSRSLIDTSLICWFRVGGYTTEPRIASVCRVLGGHKRHIWWPATLIAGPGPWRSKRGTIGGTAGITPGTDCAAPESRQKNIMVAAKELVY